MKNRHHIAHMLSFLVLICCVPVTAVADAPVVFASVPVMAPQGGNPLPASADMTPQIHASDAIAAARLAVNQRDKTQVVNFSVPQLEVINVAQLRGHKTGASRLAWLIEATGDVYEAIWVDAHTGSVLLQVSRVAHALARDVRDKQGTCTNSTSSTINYTEGSPAPVLVEALFAWNHAKAAYDYFFGTFARDGIDGAGANGTLLIRVCNVDLAFTHSIDAPPMENAQWNGSQMLFGYGMAAADDIVAHEYTHALIDNIGNGRGSLLLTGQSGALAEAFADIFWRGHRLDPSHRQRRQ